MKICAVLSLFLCVACSTTVRRAGEADPGSVTRWEGTSAMTSSTGVEFAPPFPVILERQILRDENKIVELRTARAQTERVEMLRSGESARFEAVSDMGPSGSVTFEGEEWAWDRWRYDLKMSDGSGRVEGSAVVRGDELVIERWFVTPDGVRRAKVVDRLVKKI